MAVVISLRFLDGCCHFLKPVAVISGRLLDGWWMLKKMPSSLERPTTTAGTLSNVLER